LSVVGGFVFGWRNAADRGVQPPVVVPVDVAGGGQLDVGQGLPRPVLFDQPGLVQADRRFHQALSSASPTVPIEASIPASIRWAVNAKLVYFDPASL
jgi:hypothetical protein